MTTFPSQSQQTLEMYKRLKMFSFTLYNRTVEDEFPTVVESVLLFLFYFLSLMEPNEKKKKNQSFAIWYLVKK